METNISSIASGKAVEYTSKNKKFLSAYKKDNFLQTCQVNNLGILEDTQVETAFHGGIDGAIHIGSTKHFKEFSKLYGKELDTLAIGCNIFIDDYDESDIYVGDIYSIGDIKIEVCQPRQPCWKIGAIFGKEISRYISNYQATGWYVRILNEGILDSKNPIKLEKRVSELSIKELSIYLKNPPKENQKLIDTILNTPALAQAYKKDFLKVVNKSLR